MQPHHGAQKLLHRPQSRLLLRAERALSFRPDNRQAHTREPRQLAIIDDGDQATADVIRLQIIIVEFTALQVLRPDQIVRIDQAALRRQAIAAHSLGPDVEIAVIGGIFAERLLRHAGGGPDRTRIRGGNMGRVEGNRPRLDQPRDIGQDRLEVRRKSLGLDFG